MKIKHDDIIIDAESPFANCKLGREKYANVLTSLVSTYADGFVLAINSEWGTGKTTFVRMWEAQLKKAGVCTINFNAWENDFEVNPLIAFIAELKSFVNPNSSKSFNKLLEKGAEVFENVAPVMVKHISKRVIPIDEINEVIEKASEGLSKVLRQEIKGYKEKKEGIREFKESLASFVASVKNDKPIVFIIDELDRCRPNYAVELLEQIKHFFSVPGIVFVLSIDKEQLGHAIRGVYGSDRINANEYLRRFIDLEYTLPAPETKDFVIYLYKYFAFNDIFLSDERRRINEFQHEPDDFADLATMLFDKGHLSLRQQEKIFAHARIALNALKARSYLFPTVFLFLVYLRNIYPDQYKSIRVKKYRPQDLLDLFPDVFPVVLDKYKIRSVHYLEALLVYLYSQYLYERGSSNVLYQKAAESNPERFFVKTKISLDNEHEFQGILKMVIENWDYRGISLKIVLDKIDLVEQITI